MSTLKVDELRHSDGTTTTEVNIPALDQRFAQAWVNFDGTGTVAIRDQFNVSSITDNGTGNYTVNFTTAMASTNYCFLGSTNRNGANGNQTVEEQVFANRGTNHVDFFIRSAQTSSITDNAIINVAIFEG
jgi:hypothetical protein